jgi:hypothetical protein
MRSSNRVREGQTNDANMCNDEGTVCRTVVCCRWVMTIGSVHQRGGITDFEKKKKRDRIFEERFLGIRNSKTREKTRGEARRTAMSTCSLAMASKDLSWPSLSLRASA